MKRDCFPILLPNKSHLTDLIISDAHITSRHSGIYSVLRELRLKFWILRYYSAVKRILRKCVKCKRYNTRAIKLNQNAYREFRSSPSEKPYSSIFIDLMGPWNVKIGSDTKKVYILIITCLFTRAVNLKLLYGADTDTFLRALQLHVYEYGIFQECRADLGSQIKAGFNLLKTFWSDCDTCRFLNENGIKAINMEQYCKGNSKLGSLVESLVKQTKYMLNKCIGTKILKFLDFELAVCQTVHLINRRPVAFKDSLRNSDDVVPEPITPEMLIHGYPLVSLNTIPHMQPSSDSDPDFKVTETTPSKLDEYYSKVRKTREKLSKVYHGEFLGNLISQAVDQKGRYAPVKHDSISEGDIVLLSELYAKPTNYPMGRVIKCETNDLNEVTAAWVLKGNGEKVYRHSSSLIPLLKCNLEKFNQDQVENLAGRTPPEDDENRPKESSG